MMNTDNTKIFKQLGKKQVLNVLKTALKDGKNFGLDKSFEVNNVLIPEFCT